MLPWRCGLTWIETSLCRAQRRTVYSESLVRMKSKMWSMFFGGIQRLHWYRPRKGMKLQVGQCGMWASLKPGTKSDFPLQTKHSLIHSFSDDSCKYSLNVYHVPCFEEIAVRKIHRLVFKELSVSVTLILLWLLSDLEPFRNWFLTFEIGKESLIPLHSKANRETHCWNHECMKPWKKFNLIEMIRIILMNEQVLSTFCQTTFQSFFLASWMTWFWMHKTIWKITGHSPWCWNQFLHLQLTCEAF